MIALRGKLERVQKQTPVSSASSPEAPAAATTTADAKEELKTVEQWTWKGHWGFGGKLPEDEKLIQSFLYTFEKAVPPEDVLVPSQNYAPGVEDALERRFKEEMAERARRKQLEEEEEEARQEKKKESLLAATTTSKEENQYRTDAAEKEPEKKASKEEHLGNKTDDTEPSITETKKAEEPAKTKEEEKEKTTAPEQVKNPLVDSEKKQDESKEESAKIESTSRTQKKIEDNTATVKKSKILDNENMDKVKEEDKSKPSKLPESKTPTNDNKEETANAKSKRDTLEKDPAFTRRSKVTFATPPEDDDPPFTDAASKYPDKCPPGGSWTGYFENTIKPANKRKGKNAAPVIQQIMENFHVYLNATPPKDATYMFPDSDAPASRNKTTSNKEDTATASAEGALKEGHIHVRGAGTNQFGTYELIGYFDPETSILECQRMYVAPLEPPRTPTRRGSGRGGGAAGLQRTPLESNDGRPYFTRKRQPNWRRRSSFGSTGSDSDDDGAVTPGATRKRSSSAAGGSGGKRVRMTEPKSSTTTAAAGAVAGAGGTAKSTIGGGAVPRGGLSITIPGSTGKRPGPSPKGLGTPRKKVATGIGTPKSGGSTPGSVSGPTHYMRLPAVGDPKHAAWRAAHYLYYQRSDPSQESEGGAEKSTTGTNAAGNAFKYVVYEGELHRGMREGRGVCLYNNQMIYEGDWKHNKEHGRGILLTSDRKRIIYDGEFERGRMHGRGTYYYSSGVTSGSKQHVTVEDGKSKKKGNAGTAATSISDIQSYYEGEFRDGARHGYGKYVLPDGSVYEGMWREGMMCGRGLFSWSDGSVYDGDWKDGKRHGNGILRASDGFTYDGHWQNNAMEGRGTAVYPNRQTYNGLFVQGRREGRGTLLFTNGAVYEGRFKDDALEGQGTLKMPTTMTVPRPKKKKEQKPKEDSKPLVEGEPAAKTMSEDTAMKEEGKVKEEEMEDEKEEENLKPDYMIPLSFQSDMGHIHQKAGFTVGGE